MAERLNPKRKLLVVDDIAINRAILHDLFMEEYDILEAANGNVAWDFIQLYQEELSVVLLDIVMPEMDGIGVLECMNESGIIQTVPVIFITSETDDTKALMGYGLGVSDMINKPFNPEIVYRRVKNVIQLYAHNRELEERLRAQAIKLRQANQFVIDALSTTVEFRNSESGEHIKRIRYLTRILLEGMQSEYPLTQEEIENISSASAMHDIGKIAIPDSILLKPGRLTVEEFNIMKTHTIRGCEILQTLNYTQDPDFYKYCYEICRYHHERWDGNGYPDGLVGDQIPIWAQATSLADVYDALTSPRVYKEAYSHEDAVAMILNGACGVFNPKMLDCFMRVKDTLNDEIHKYDGK
ncbi:response regulator [Eubacteriales bacterium OttesenSCG-928-M02]|nr:response regulator [Eubacteriales bacterium OttesenSCG-928-M02]